MTAPLPIREAIVVEGRYDKAALAGVVDTLILDTAGFGVFRDGEKLALLRRLAEKRGLIFSHALSLISCRCCSFPIFLPSFYFEDYYITLLLTTPPNVFS